MTLSDIQDRIAQTKKRRTEEFDCPLLGKVSIQSLTTSEIRAIKGKSITKDGRIDIEKHRKLDAHLIAACVCNGDNKPCLTVEEVDELDSVVTGALAAKCREFTNWDADANWKAIEAAAKNSESVP